MNSLIKDLKILVKSHLHISVSNLREDLLCFDGVNLNSTKRCKEFNKILDKFEEDVMKE